MLKFETKCTGLDFLEMFMPQTSKRSQVLTILIWLIIRKEIRLGARQKQITQLPVNLSQSAASSSSGPKYRPRSHSPNPKQSRSHALRPSTSEKTYKVQQSRSLDERRSRISRQRNSSFSNLQEEPLNNGGLTSTNLRMENQATQTQYSRYSPQPPTITLRRPSQTCLPVEHGIKCSDPLYQASLCLGEPAQTCWGQTLHKSALAQFSKGWSSCKLIILYGLAWQNAKIRSLSFGSSFVSKWLTHQSRL